VTFIDETQSLANETEVSSATPTTDPVLVAALSPLVDENEAHVDPHAAETIQFVPRNNSLTPAASSNIERQEGSNDPVRIGDLLCQTAVNNNSPISFHGSLSSPISPRRAGSLYIDHYQNNLIEYRYAELLHYFRVAVGAIWVRSI